MKSANDGSGLNMKRNLQNEATYIPHYLHDLAYIIGTWVVKLFLKITKNYDASCHVIVGNKKPSVKVNAVKLSLERGYGDT